MILITISYFTLFCVWVGTLPLRNCARGPPWGRTRGLGACESL